MNETPYYQDADVEVLPSLIRIGGTSYPVGAITQVQLFELGSKKPRAFMVGAFALFILVAALPGLRHQLVLTLPLMIGAVAALVWSTRQWRRPATYGLSLATAGHELH